MPQNSRRGLKSFHPRGLRAWLTAAAMLLGAVAAHAGDRAQLNYLGFSDDGRYFAYEQYGIEDGSGDFYSSIFVLDLAKDRLMDGSPFSAEGLGDDAASSLPATRAAALHLAQSLLEQYGIINPVAVAALNGDGLLGPDGLPLDGKAIRFGQPFYAGIQYDYTMTLEQLDVPNSDTCRESADSPYQGFALTLADNENAAEAPRELHRDAGDKPLPALRGCALYYSIYSIVYPLESEGDPVALISIYTQGFEGLSRRFVAVPVGRL